MKMDVRCKYSLRGHTTSFAEFCGPLKTTQLAAPSVAPQQQFNYSSAFIGAFVSTNKFSASYPFTVADKQPFTRTEISCSSTDH
jgi:hypothetical protein